MKVSKQQLFYEFKNNKEIQKMINETQYKDYEYHDCRNMFELKQYIIDIYNYFSRLYKVFNHYFSDGI